MFNGTRELNHFKSAERGQRTCMQSSCFHRQLALTRRSTTAARHFRKDVEMLSSDFGFVLALAGFNRIKNLKDILATRSIQT